MYAYTSRPSITNHFLDNGFFDMETTFLKAASKSFGLSDAPTSRAISTKRLWRSASVSLESDDTGFFLGAFFTCPDIFPPVILSDSHNHSGGSFSHSKFAAELARIRRMFFELRFKCGDARPQYGNLLAICKDASKCVFDRHQPFQTKMSLDRGCHA
jgi:hypothetical protein